MNNIMNLFNCGCTSVDNIEIPTQIDNKEEIIEESDYTILYNKLFMVSMEFNKMKQGLHTMRIEQTNTERELVELKQKMASISNDNNTIEDTLLTNSNNDNTIIFMSIYNLTDTKKKLIHSIKQNSNFNVILGLDSKYAHCINELKEITGDNNDIILLDYDKLIGKYTSKINNFNGKWETNPSKLGAYDWFNNSTYSYMWYIEDDVFSKDWDVFFNKYKDNNCDLIYKYISEFPSWYYKNWRVGSKLHAIHLAHLYVHRVSKSFTNKLIDTIKNEHNTSHHELFIPYVRYKYNCSYKELDVDDTKYSTTNGTGENVGYSKEFIERNESNLFHPVKIL
jgi:hypothetical protein